ncbi:hypothetical protein [Streptomyces sp. NPDC055210]
MNITELAVTRQRWAAEQQPNPLALAVAARDQVGTYLNFGDVERGLIVVDRAIAAVQAAQLGPGWTLPAVRLPLPGYTPRAQSAVLPGSGRLSTSLCLPTEPQASELPWCSRKVRIIMAAWGNSFGIALSVIGTAYAIMAYHRPPAERRAPPEGEPAPRRRRRSERPEPVDISWPLGPAYKRAFVSGTIGVSVLVLSGTVNGVAGISLLVVAFGLRIWWRIRHSGEREELPRGHAALVWAIFTFPFLFPVGAVFLWWLYRLRTGTWRLPRLVRTTPPPEPEPSA